MISTQRALAACTLMLATFFLLKFLSSSEEVKPNKPFATFPTTMGEWKGKEERFDESIYNALGVDDSFLGNYYSPDGRYVQLYIGFYQSQKEGDLIHSPKNCMPGAGWNITGTELVEVDMPNFKEGKASVIQLFLQKGDQKQLVLYWFQSRGRIINSEYLEKIYLVVDSITRHRTDGSFVRLIAPVVDNNEAQCLDSLKAFIRELSPYLLEYIPS